MRLYSVYDMALKRQILIFFTSVMILDLSQCTKIQGVLAEAEKSMDIMKMFDRFFHIRFTDEFFRKNFEQEINDDIRKYYPFETSDTLLRDFIIHASYFENTGWYSTSFTELFSILYVKYLATSYVIEFRSCELYYLYGEKNRDISTACQKVTRYFLKFIQFGLKRVLSRVEEMLNLLAWKGYGGILESIRFYFGVVTRDAFDEPFLQLPSDKKNFFKTLWIREMKNIRNNSFQMRDYRFSKMEVKYFFRNLLFGTPYKYKSDFRINIKEEDEMINELNFDEIQEKSINFWKIVFTLVEKIETADPQNLKTNVDGIEIIPSNVTQLIRILEIEKLAAIGIDKKEDTQFRLGTSDTILQLLLSPSSKSYLRMQFIEVNREDLEQPMKLEYPELTQQLKETVFSEEEFVSAQENVTSASAPNKQKIGQGISSQVSNGDEEENTDEEEYNITHASRYSEEATVSESHNVNPKSASIEEDNVSELPSYAPDANKMNKNDPHNKKKLESALTDQQKAQLAAYIISESFESTSRQLRENSRQNWSDSRQNMNIAPNNLNPIRQEIAVA